MPWPPQMQMRHILPAFRRDNDYVERADPYTPSKKHTLKVYRYRLTHDRVEAEFGGWKHVDLPSKHMKEHQSIRIVSWNIDFEAHHVVDRATAALEYLQKTIFECRTATDSPGPCVIMLQEVHAKALRDAFRANEWLRNHFIMTPIDHVKWPKLWMHGNITLIERSVRIRDAHCLEYGLSDQTRMAVVVNISLSSASEKNTSRHITLVNTQLDDIPSLNTYRRRQLRECMMAVNAESGGIVAGGMSIFSDEENVGPEFLRELGLRDAAGHGEEDEKGFTWGYQKGRGAVKSRPDKILYHSPPGRRRELRVSPPKRIGLGLRYGPRDDYVSDHFGLTATVEVRG